MVLGKSAHASLILFVDELAKNMSKGKQTDVAILDFSKAFDVVPHKRLLHKLDFYGIQGSGSAAWSLRLQTICFY